MNNCLITKLKGSVDNQDLLKAGELRVNVIKMDNPTYKERSLAILSSQPLTVSIIGDGYFTDTTLLQNKGTSVSIQNNIEQTLILSNGDYSLSISNKYGLVKLSTYVANSKGNQLAIDLGNLKYSTGMLNLHIANSLSTGELQDLNKMKNIVELVVNNTNVTGDLSDCTVFPLIRSLQVASTKITGDLSSIKDLTNLSSLNVASTKITGDLSSIKDLTNLSSLNVASTKITGDLSSIKGLSKLINFGASGHSYFTGNLGDIPDGVLFFMNDSKLKWEGSNREYILALYAVTVENLDQMLIDMSSMKAKFQGEDAIYKTIRVRGTRTSASDAAVATLQSKGYTVSITPA